MRDGKLWARCALEGGKSLATDVQSTIDRIRSKSVSDEELLELLTDARALVRANVLMALVNRPSQNGERIAKAVAKAAHAPAHSDVRLMGSVNQRILSVATLAWLQTDVAKTAYERELQALAEVEKQRVLELVADGPIS